MLVVPLVILLGPLTWDDTRAIATGPEPVLARYEIDLDGRSRATFALPPGRRTIRAFRWVPAPGSTDAWRSARLLLVWDGDSPEAAGVDLPLGRFVSAVPGGPGRPAAYVNFRPMPYRVGGRLIIDATGPVRGSIRLDARPGGDVLDERGYLRAAVGGAGDSPGPPPEFRAGGGDGAASTVRYWYDRAPGPRPE